MTETDIMLRLALALGIGLFLGLERGWHGRNETEGKRLAGIRTFALAGLLGGVAGWLGQMTSLLFPAIALAVLGALLAVGYHQDLRRGSDLGLTTETALVLTYALGVAAMLGPAAPVAAIAVMVALLLSMKARLHALIEKLAQAELAALIKLALISVAVLPFLPDRGFGPGALLNPYQLWWAVVIVAGLSFLGYAAIRLTGPRIGILATGVFGGLASSTSTTLALARLGRARGELAPLVAVGTICAGSVALGRVIVLTAIFAPTLLAQVALPLGVMAGGGMLGALVIHGRARGMTDAQAGGAGVTNPLELRAALVFAAILGAVLVGVSVLGQWLGAGGVYAAAALSGLTDLDALTISVSRLVGDGLSARQGAIAITIAAAVNTAVKAAIALGAGDKAAGRPVALTYAAVIAAGGAALWATG